MAKSHERNGELDESRKLYQSVLDIFPKNKRAQQGVIALSKPIAIPANQNPPQDIINQLINLYNTGHLYEVIEQAENLTTKYPYAFIVWNLLGAANKGLGLITEAANSFKKVTRLNPNYANGFNNLGVILQEHGELEDAIVAYNNAISLNPNYAEAYNNKGNALKDQGKLGEAIEAFKKTLSLRPDYAEAYNNMGIVLQYQGKLEEAVEACKKTLSLQPDHAEAYNNIGNALQDQGKLKEAIEAFKKAVYLKPDYAEALWNLSGTAENITESKSWIEQCLKADQNHLKAKLTYCALQFYDGNKSDFNDLMQSSLKDDPYARSFAWAFNLPELPPLYFDRWAFFDHIIELSTKARPFYEFGVWRGEAFRHLIKAFKKGYGFDTFEGIPEDWHDEKTGTYSSDGDIPQIEGGEFIVGKFEDTLPKFFSEPRPAASVINFDADLYSSTICALNFSKPLIDRLTILVFDEFIINKNWEQDEYKALNEFCLKNNYTYEVLAISFFTKQAAVRLIGL